MRLFFLFLLSLFILSCSPSSYQYHSLSPEKNPQGWRELPIYVDATFSHEEKNVIRNVIMEWNHVLNGNMEIKLETWNFRLESKEGQRIKEIIDTTDEGIMLLSVKHDDPILGQMQADDTLAFVDRLGNRAHYLVVIDDRIGRRNLHKILLHEFGHALGAMHVSARSLMFPYVGWMQRNCVDKITMLQVANYHHFDPAYLNYCSTPELE